MRILGWLLLVGGLLLCVSILWAAPGFFCMGLGLIFLQIAERKRRKAKSAASPSDQSEPQAEQAQIPEATWAVVPPETEEDAGAGRENVTGLHSYDRQEWRALLSSDADISRLAKVLESYGQKYVDEFAAAYLALNDKDYLPAILRNIVASASRDSRQNIASGAEYKSGSGRDGFQQNPAHRSRSRDAGRLRRKILGRGQRAEDRCRSGKRARIAAAWRFIRR
jgi:hypothetical protein